jgi:hypothetical protein
MMLACFGSLPGMNQRYFGLLVTALGFVVSVQSAVAFEDRFGDSRDKHWGQYTDSRRDGGSMQSGSPGMSGRGGGTEGTNSRGDDGGGFPGPGGRNSGSDDHRGPGRGDDDGPGGRGRGPGR